MSWGDKCPEGVREPQTRDLQQQPPDSEPHTLWKYDSLRAEDRASEIGRGANLRDGAEWWVWSLHGSSK